MHSGCLYSLHAHAIFKGEKQETSLFRYSNFCQVRFCTMKSIGNESLKLQAENMSAVFDSSILTSLEWITSDRVCVRRRNGGTGGGNRCFRWRHHAAVSGSVPAADKRCQSPDQWLIHTYTHRETDRQTDRQNTLLCFAVNVFFTIHGQKR